MRQVLEHAHVLIWEKQFEKKKFFKFFFDFSKIWERNEILKFFKILNNWARNWFSAKTFQKMTERKNDRKMTDVAKLEIADVFS